VAGDYNTDRSHALPRSEASLKLEAWRDHFTVGDAVERCTNNNSKFTVAVLGSGGCVDTISAIRAGWSPIWGTEVCPEHNWAPADCHKFKRTINCDKNKQQKIWTFITKTKCLGNTFSDTSKYTKLQRPVNITAGQPCTDYCLGGGQEGAEGQTGWMFVQQMQIILSVKPLTFRLEMSDNAVNINDGKEVLQIQDEASKLYFTRQQVLRVWEHGDGSNRSRLFFVGFLRTPGMQDAMLIFSFPQPTFDSVHGHCARDWAVPDNEVPDHCWRKNNTWRIQHELPEQGKIHYLARAGYGMGPSHNPNQVTSWDRVAPGTTTWNGNNRRPKLSWIDTGFNPVGPTRVTTAVENPRQQSLPYDYRGFVAQFDSSDRFLWLCCHNGIPLRTCNLVDSMQLDVVKLWLTQQLQSQQPARELRLVDNEFINTCIRAQLASKQHNIHAAQAFSAAAKAYQGDSKLNHWSSHISGLVGNQLDGNLSGDVHIRQQQKIKSALVDTGANATLMFTSTEEHMTNPRGSNLRIQVADSDTNMQGSKDGILHMLVLGPIKQPKQPIISPKVTTVPNLHRELFSVDGYFLDGFNILLKQPNYEDGIPQMHKPAAKGNMAITIPFRYDYHNSGFWLDYLLVPNGRSTACSATSNMQINQHKDELLALLVRAYSADMKSSTSREAYDSIQWLSAGQASATAQNVYAMDAVTEIFFGQHAEERTILGVKSGLRRRKRELTKQQFHEEYQHMGSCPGCLICIMVSGCMRRIYKQVDPHTERRRAFTFDMDTITYSHRSSYGNRYETVIKCRATKTYFSLFLYLRSDMLLEFEKWVTVLREKSYMQGMGYKACSILRLDNAGEWELDYAAWREMGDRLGIEFSYTSADRKEENAPAERACGIKECKTKAGILQQNLEPSWWQDKSIDVNWLLNRFPVVSMAVSVPSDGDRSRPLEDFSGGQISRRTIDRQLYYYVSPGTPALVHDIAVKGSHIATKTRWMVAKAMYNEHVIFWCPYTRAEVKTKSYTAFKLRTGVHWTQVCGIAMPAPTKRSLLLSTDLTEKITVQLPQPNLDGTNIHHLGQPVTAIKHTSMTCPAPSVTQTGTQAGTKGSFTVKDSNGKELIANTDTGELVSFSATKNTYSAYRLTAVLRAQVLANDQNKTKQNSQAVRSVITTSTQLIESNEFRLC
jgi:site-specific DNA-cytosine methylase